MSTSCSDSWTVSFAISPSIIPSIWVLAEFLILFVLGRAVHCTDQCEAESDSVQKGHSAASSKASMFLCYYARFPGWQGLSSINRPFIPLIFEEVAVPYSFAVRWNTILPHFTGSRRSARSSPLFVRYLVSLLLWILQLWKLRLIDPCCFRSTKIHSKQDLPLRWELPLEEKALALTYWKRGSDIDRLIQGPQLPLYQTDRWLPYISLFHSDASAFSFSECPFTFIIFTFPLFFFYYVIAALRSESSLVFSLIAVVRCLFFCYLVNADWQSEHIVTSISGTCDGMDKLTSILRTSISYFNRL